MKKRKKGFSAQDESFIDITIENGFSDHEDTPEEPEPARKKHMYECNCGMTFENSQKKAAHCKSCKEWRAKNEPTRSRIKPRKKKFNLNLSIPKIRGPMNHNKGPRKNYIKRKKVYNEDDSSDEERSYKRSLKRRMALEQAERIAVRETREKFEQQHLNRRFFRLKGNEKSETEEESIYQQIITANLFDTSRTLPITQDFELLSLPTKKEELHIPAFRSVEEDEAYRNFRAEQEFNKNYKEGLLRTESECKEEIFKKRHISPSKHSRIFKFFHPEIWSDEETLFFKELLCSFGKNWPIISQLLISKSPQSLENFYVANGYHIYCHICGTSTDDDQLLLCDRCDRAFHTYCLKPPVEKIPTTEWYCSEECSHISKKKCEICHLDQEEPKVLLCGNCEKVYHPQCLNPPIREIPKGEWTCGCNKRRKKKKTISNVDLLSKLQELETENVKINDETSESAKSPRTVKKIEKEAIRLQESLLYTFSFEDIKDWVQRTLSTDLIDLKEIKENNISDSDYHSIFKLDSVVDTTQLQQHFETILVAVNNSIDSMVSSPRIAFATRHYLRSNNKEYEGYPESWIIKVNSNTYDLITSKTAPFSVTWYLQQRQGNLRSGDKIYFWLTGSLSGIFATGTILNDPIPTTALSPKKNNSSNQPVWSRMSVLISVEHLLPQKLDLGHFFQDKFLSHLEILATPIGPIFHLKMEEAQTLDNLLQTIYGEKTVFFRKRFIPVESTLLNGHTDKENQRGDICCICEKVQEEKFIFCDSCDRAYHFSCLKIPKRSPKKEILWFCPECRLNNLEVIAAKFIIGFKELQVEIKRLMQEQCKMVGQKHAENVATFSIHQSAKLKSQLHEYTIELAAARVNYLVQANLVFQPWKNELMSEYQIKNHQLTD